MTPRVRIPTCTLIIQLLIAASFIHYTGAQTMDSIQWKNRHVNVEDGLLNRFINCITEDERGFIWIGTNFGINRYDGHRIEVMTREENGLSTNIIYGLHLDQNHKLWAVQRETRLAAISHIDIIDPLTFEVQPVSDYLHDSDLKDKEITNVFSGEHSEIFILSGTNVLYRFDKQGLHSILPKDFNRGILNLRYIDDGIYFQNSSLDTLEYWSSNGEYIASYKIPHFYKEDRTQIKFSYFGLAADGNRLFEASEIGVPTHELYVLTTEAVIEKKLEFKVPVNTTNLPACFWDNYRKSVWIQTPESFFNLDPTNGKMIYPELVLSPRITSCYVSHDGRVWKGTEDGIFIYKSLPLYFKSVLKTDQYQYSVRGITRDTNGIIYVLTHGGHFKYFPETNRVEKWDHHFNFVGMASITDHRGNIWMTEESGICYQFNPYKDTYTRSVPVTTGYFSTWALKELSTGDIGIGTTQGLWIKNPNDSFPPVQFNIPEPNDALNHSTVMHMTENEEGLWLATSNGLFLVDLHSGVKEHIDEKSSGLPNNSLLFVYIDPGGAFWLGSRGGGLIKWNRKENKFQTFSTLQGLSNNVIYAVYEDDFGFLWLPSDFGLMRFEKSTGNCRTFLPNDGIPHEEFNRSSHFKDKQGNFYFGGLNGFLVFNPRDIRQSSDAHYPLLITRFEVLNGTSGNLEDWTSRVLKDESIVLQSSMKSFILHYAILDYDDPRLKRYAYKIEGLDEHWNYIKENFIRVNGLSGGNYRLHVKGQSATGQWSENEIILPLTVLKPVLYRTTTLVGLFLLAAGLIFYFMRRRNRLQTRRLQREQAISQQLRQVDKLKDQFLANTSHELRTPLNGIVGLSESLLENAHTKAEKEDLELIVSSGRRLSNLVNDILDFSRLKEHDLQLQLKPVDIRTIADLCLRVNKPNLQDKPIVLVNRIPEDIPYCLADENRFQQILQNLVSNAIKFTREGEVIIHATVDGDLISISVTDTGIGIDKSNLESIFREFEQADGSISREFGGTGLGLSISKYLVELHGGTIQVKSEPGIGSSFSFTLPVFKGEYNHLHDTSKVTSVLISEKEMVTEMNGNGRSTAYKLNENAKKNILVVDDEPINLKVLKNHLEQEGFTVTLAKDGQEALGLLENGNKYHLVLLDVMMPRVSGYEVCQRIREKYMLSQLPIIMVTSKNQVNDLVEGLTFGANDYIIKPFSKDELLARVKTQLNTYDIYEATDRFVPHEFLDILGRNSITELNRGDMVEKNVHVMFSDIRDYTSLAEDMTPLENFQFVNSLAGKIGPVVKQNRGIINQYLGDTIMMLFMDKADHGVQAGVDILRLMQEYNSYRKARQRKIVHLGIGLHSGPLMMGIIGDLHRTDAAVISDSVNTASRIEGLTKFYNVNFMLSEDTYKKLEDPEKFSLRYLGKVQAKGKFHP
ncbi:MAG: response regulator, partial [Saprospiraceae bacterium]